MNMPAYKINKLTLQLILVTIGVILINLYVQRERIATIFRAGNIDKQVIISIYPRSITTTDKTAFTVSPMLTSNKTVGYIELVITFDRKSLTFIENNESKLNSDNQLESF